MKAFALYGMKDFDNRIHWTQKITSHVFGPYELHQF